MKTTEYSFQSNFNDKPGNIPGCPKVTQLCHAQMCKDLPAAREMKRSRLQSVLVNHKLTKQTAAAKSTINGIWQT